MSEFLPKLNGRWRGVTTTWFEPGPGFQDPWEVEFRLLPGGNFALQEHSIQVQGQPHQGWALIGRDDHEHYSVSLADSFHTSTTGVLHMTGGLEDGALSVLGSYAAGEERWGWRTTMTFEGESLLIRAFNIAPDGSEYPALEARLNR